MISFIVIGRNEGWKLTKCFQSIYDTISYNELTDYEIIYVDSKSTDDSIERAKQFGRIKIFQITGVCNAAIARNIGAKESRGDVLFFIDGDMEIIPEFIKLIPLYLNDKNDYAITGHLIDNIYDANGKFLEECPRTYQQSIPDKKQELLTSGGLLIISKKLWDIAGGMKNKYKRCQDNDLTLRLKKNGYDTIRVPYLIAFHHTIDYRDDKRMWKLFFSGATLYLAVIIRDHITNRRIVKQIIRAHYTSVVLLLAALSLLVSISLLSLFIPIYLAVVLLRVALNMRTSYRGPKKSVVKYYFERALFQILRDISFPLAIVFFYPNSQKLEYVKVNDRVSSVL